VAHPELSSPSIETDPLLVRGDPLTMYFASNRAGTSDVYVAHRPAVDQLFDAPGLITELSTPTYDENGMIVDTSGHGYFASTMAGNADLYEIARPSAAQPFAIVRALDELDDAQPQLDVFPCNDDLELWYSTVGAGTSQDIMFATRNNRAQPFGAPMPFVYNSSAAEAGATLTDYRLVVVWTSAASGDVYYATRPTVQDAWSAPQTIGPGVVSTSDIEGEPSIRGDGCELFFIRIDGGVDWNIYSVAIAP
jgi:hypothetical protein